MADLPLLELLLWEAMLDAILDGDVAEVESLDESLLQLGYVVEMDSKLIWLRHLANDHVEIVVPVEVVQA